jgi:hypothetical protein
MTKIALFIFACIYSAFADNGIIGASISTLGSTIVNPYTEYSYINISPTIGLKKEVINYELRGSLVYVQPIFYCFLCELQELSMKALNFGIEGYSNYNSIQIGSGISIQNEWIKYLNEGSNFEDYMMYLVPDLRIKEESKNWESIVFLGPTIPIVQRRSIGTEKIKWEIGWRLGISIGLKIFNKESENLDF